MSSPSTATRPQALDAIIRMCHDIGAELWLSYRTREGRPCVCRLLLFDAKSPTFIGGVFEIPSDYFLFIGATRERRDELIRLDNCSDIELAEFLQDASIPFSLGWSDALESL